jgi:hypothetical protein
MTEMRVLTVRQPWADAIVWGNKGVENRTRNIAGDYRGPVAIHSSVREPSPDEWNVFGDRFPEAMDRMAQATRWDQEPHGVILGVVDLWAVHEHDGSERFLCCPNSPDRFTRWAEPGVWHLCLARPRPLVEPIRYRGGLGLRRLDDGTRLRVESGVQHG